MSFWILLSVGVALIIAEMFSGSFFLLFVGVGFVLTGVLEWLIGFESFSANPILIQAGLICLISILSLVFVKPSIKRLLQQSEEYKEDFLNEQGEGEIKQGMVYFKGTLWSFEGDRHYDEGQKVRVKGVKDNHLILE